MGKYRITVDLQRCEAGAGCPLNCISVCPTKVLAHRYLNPVSPSLGFHVQATHPLLCSGCMECVRVCGPGAIDVGASPQ